VESDTGHTILSTWQYGKGRVVAFTYRNNGLSSEMPMSARIRTIDLSREYCYALLCRSMICAAGREPSRLSDWNAPAKIGRLKAESGRLQASSHGPRPATWELPSERYFQELQASSDFQIESVDVPRPDGIENLPVPPDVISEGDSVEGSWTATQPAAAGGSERGK
jgi:hypothetical protein